MRLSLIALATTLALTACTQAPQSTTPTDASAMVVTAQQSAVDESARLNEWFNAKYEAEVLESPINLTYLGRSERKGEIDDFSPEAMAKSIATKQANLAQLKAQFDYNQLSDTAKISYDFWVYQTEQAVAEYAYRDNSYVFDQMTAIHSFFPQLLIALHSVATVEDMEFYLQRISGSAHGLDQLIASSKAIAAKGVRPPYFAFDAVINESQKIITGAPFTDAPDSAIWNDAKTKVNGLVEAELLEPAEADVLLADIKTALVTELKPAYERLIQWQKTDQVNATAQAKGVSALPDGQAYYNQRLANQTTTTLTADEIHNIGLAEVTRLKNEMEVVKAEFGFSGSLQEFFVFLRENKDDERLYYPNTDAGRQGYLDDATAAINKIKAVLPEYFGILPKADMVVKRVEAFREQDGAAQHYSPSTPDGSRPGVYYAHLSDMTAMPKRELEVIAYHEGLPGHHMQIAISLELKGIPTFRQQSYLNAYGEGWALYSEWLAKQMPGTYQDPLSEFGRLGSEMWRAIRLVVDTGLHAKGWSEAQAIAYFKENSAITSEQAQSEVRRYLVMPGQATGYKIGMLKIQSLRAMAEEQLGDKFDIRAFHDTILGGGALPMTILERQVKAWIVAQQAK